MDYIQEHIELIRRIERAKIELPSLKINWETDIEKMDFSKLENAIPFLKNNISLNLAYIEETPVSVDEIFDGYWPASFMFDFLKIVKRSEKIIPPITRVGYEVTDGIIKKIEKQFLCNKGKRMLLARLLCCQKIPTLLWEVVQVYKFTPSLYVFKCIENKIIIENKSSGQKFVIDLDYYHIDIDETSQFVLILN